MSAVALSTILAVAAVAYGQSPTDTAIVPLASKHFQYPDGIPYQADPNNGVRGTQQGYNICNSTTENQQSLCQTSFLNHIDDFCLWSSPKPDETIGDTEGEEVAWCTKPGHGSRLIPAGAITGVQYVKTPDYLQVVGFIDQTQINLAGDDSGGELDPHGADLRGNPLGGLVYTNGFASNNGNNGTYQQVIEWHNFMGSNSFCFKVCDPAGPRAPELCQHIYDRIGVQYNCPSAAQDKQFVVCDSDSQDPPGIYTSNGQVVTYTQPPESLGAISTMPYQPRVPASSNCVTFQSAQLYTALPSATAVSTSSAIASSGTGVSSIPKSTAAPSGSASRTSSGGASPTGASQTGGAATMHVSVLSTLVGAVFAVAFLS